MENYGAEQDMGGSQQFVQLSVLRPSERVEVAHGLPDAGIFQFRSDGDTARVYLDEGVWQLGWPRVAQDRCLVPDRSVWSLRQLD